ncbi:hypothetical protein ACI2KR_08420 [Pseudomonas luteola]
MFEMAFAIFKINNNFKAMRILDHYIHALNVAFRRLTMPELMAMASRQRADIITKHQKLSRYSPLGYDTFFTVKQVLSSFVTLCLD